MKLLPYLWYFLLCIALAGAPWLGGQWTGIWPPVARALVAAAGLAWIAARWGSWRLPKPAVWLWAVIAWSVLTSFQRTNLHASLLALSDLATWAAILAMAADAATDARRRAGIVGAVLAGAGLCSAIGIFHAHASGHGWREFGPFVTPNIFASYLATVLPAALYFAVRSWPADPPEDRRTPLNVAVVMAAIVTLATGSAAIMMTGSKGAVAALVLSVAVVTVATRAWRRIKPSMAVLGALLVLFAAGVGGPTLLGRVESAGTTEAHSTQFRVLTWKGAARMAASHPLIGTGIGTFGSAFNRFAIAGWTQAAHDAYLQAAAETGVPGLLLLLGALASAGVCLWKRARTGSIVASAALAGLMAAAIHNGVDYGWSLWGPSAVMWALIGAGQEDAYAVRVPRWAAATIAAALALTLTGAILVANAASIAEPALDHTRALSPAQRVDALRTAAAIDPLDGTLARELGIALAQDQDGAGAVSELKRAIALAPNDAVAWRLLGEAYAGSGAGDEARRAYQSGLAVSPSSYKLLLDAARLEQSAGRNEIAFGYYRRIVAAAEGPVGRYPATPEIVDIEPMHAYSALAGDADARGDRAAADGYRRKLVALAERYERNRVQYAMIWRATGKDDPAALAEVQSLRASAERALSGPRSTQ